VDLASLCLSIRKKDSASFVENNCLLPPEMLPFQPSSMTTSDTILIKKEEIRMRSPIYLGLLPLISSLSSWVVTSLKQNQN